MAQSEVQPAMRTKYIIITFLIMVLCSTSAQAQMDERVAKAVYIYNFLRLTEWPALLKQPFHLCILGHTPLDDQIHTLDGKQVRSGVPIVVKHVSISEDLDYCKAIYFEGDKHKHTDLLLRKLQGIPALTISDADGLADHGVMIEINKQGKRLVFEINLKAALQVKMNFSARLLKLASFVTTP